MKSLANSNKFFMFVLLPILIDDNDFNNLSYSVVNEQITSAFEVVA